MKNEINHGDCWFKTDDNNNPIDGYYWHTGIGRWLTYVEFVEVSPKSWFGKVVWKFIKP